MQAQLGSPPVTKLAYVRETTLGNKRMVGAGIDPLQAKRKTRSIPTFEEAAQRLGVKQTQMGQC